MQKLFALTAALLFTLTTSFAQISGTVFRDFNGNGVKDNGASFNEPFVLGVTVKAFNSAGTQLGTTKTTNISGAFSFTVGEIPATTPVRIEFSGLAAGDYSSTNGSGNGTNVQFVTAPSATVNYAVNAPEDYWNNTTTPTPTFLVIAVRRGLTTGGYQAAEATVIQSTTALTGPYNPATSSTAATGTMTTVATQQQTGSLFGMAFQKKQQRYFASAVLKRSVQVGPQGMGGVYLFDKSGANFSLTGSFTLQGVTASSGNTATALDFGTVTRNTATPSNNNYISNVSSYPGQSRDMDAFAKAGTVSYGDIEADPNSNKIYMINLNQKRLIVFDASAATATLNGAAAATLAPYTAAYDILSLPGIPSPTGAGNNIRPYGVKIYKGVGYLGVVSDAMSTQTSADLRGYILRFDPNNIAAGFTTVLTINFDTWPTAGTRYWKPWSTTWAQTGGNGTAANPRDYPTPMIAGIEFNEDGSMDIGIKDRWGDQGANFEFNAVAGATGNTQCSINGDLLHACWTGSGWALEGTSGSCTQTGTNGTNVPDNNSYGDGYSYGNTGKEWYADRSGDGGNENNIGGMTKIMGSGQILTTIYDPLGQGETQGSNYWSTQGIQYNNVTTGVKSQIARVLPGNDGDMDKSNGMGDIEFFTDQQPIQIGNRIWVDANGNGVQDAGETTAGVPDGTTVTLRSPGVDGIYGNGDDQTWTTTTTGGNYYFSSLGSSDNRKPALWTGVGNTVLPGYDYRVEVAVPTGYQLTKADAAGNGLDNIDNDASLSGSNAIVVFNTSNTNHNFDIGFKPLATLGDKVWRDDNKNGIQDSGEPGVAGITVTLYQNGTDALPGTSDDIIIGTTVTDAYGNYLFDNLAASTGNATQYNVGFTLPANYQFTTQTNTQTTGSSNATNLTNTTGGSTAANGSDASATTGRTGSFWLAAGEIEPTVDAGIIYAQPSTNSIGDKVWYDADSDGVQDSNEAGIAGVTVTLYASDGVTVVATTVTDANGNYIFTGLPAGTDYIVGITPPAGMLLTTTSGTTSGNATTNSDFSQTTYKTTAVNTGAAGTQITGVDAGLVMQSNLTSSLGDKVWLDLNANNIQDAGEPGVAGVTVNLYRDTNGDGSISGAEASTPYATTKTDAFGNYIFNNLPCTAGLVGTFYQVGFVLPSGYSFVTKNTGTDNSKDSDAGTVSGLTQAASLRQGQRDMTIDAGLVQTSPAGTAKLGDKVWFDADADGVQDAGETGVAGVTVTLYNNVGAAIATTTTDINGNYLFANLAAGDYSVGFSNLPQGYSLTQVWSSNDANATNSDANPATGKTGTITLSAGESELDVDAGLVAGVPSGLASIGNKIWWDVITNNNVQDAGEPGVAGVTVNLYRDANGDGLINGAEASTPFATTVTNALGEYIFTGLAAGTYQVGFTNLPTGSSTVTQNSGADDNLDSDGSAVSGAISSSVSTTGLYTLATGEKNLSVDLGIINTAKGSFGNKVWFDNGTGGGTANDGIQNGTEPGVAGVMVTLTNAAGQLVDKTGTITTTPVVTTTDVNGNYIFADLTAGVSFAVKFSNLPAGYVFTTQAGTGSADDNKSDADVVNGATSTVTIVANTTASTLDGGITSTRATLGNFVWMDDDGDGVQDAGEAGVAGVTVTLYRPGFGPDGVASTADDALPVATMITDQNGQYLFSNLIAGTYEVEFSTIPGGTIFTQRNTPGDNGDNTNNDAVPQTGNPTVARTTSIVLSAGETDLTVDAGIFKPRAVIGNYVWVDSNNDGVQQATEPAAAGILVSLIDGGGNTVAVAVTDANGNYLFPNVAPGTYSISFVNLPTGTSFTSSNAGGDDNTDSDVIGTTITGIVVTTTTTNLSFDAGIVGFITLPVEGLSLNATLQNSMVTLTWKTISELNTDYFEVERSTNNASFTKTGSKVKAAGSSAFPASYTNTDDISALTNNGQVFYRIKLYDLDGRVHYSNVAVVWVKTSGIKVWPNPFAETLQVSFTATANGNVQLRLTDVTGKTVVFKKQSVAAGINQLNITSLGNISSGNYILEITEEKTSKKTSYKLTKQ